MTVSIPKGGARLISTASLKVFLGGVSGMFIERRLGDDPSFPRPLYIQGKRFWVVEELEAWIAAQPRTAPDWVVNAGARGKLAAEAGREAKARQRAEQAPAKPVAHKTRSPKIAAE
jgi:hypothetical protein